MEIHEGLCANSLLGCVQEYQNRKSLLNQQAETAHLIRQAFRIFWDWDCRPSQCHTNRKHATACHIETGIGSSRVVIMGMVCDATTSTPIRLPQRRRLPRRRTRERIAIRIRRGKSVR